MPQMHPLLWTLLFSFSFLCLIFTMSIIFFSLQKSFNVNKIKETIEAKTPSWKW